MAKTKYNLHLKGYVGGWDFDSDYVDFVLNKNTDKEVAVLIDSLGGQLNTALSISSAFRRHGNVRVHFVGMNASAATIASMGAKRITMDHSAMYLVHQCSQSFFEWGSMNATDMQNLINNLEKQKADLDKLDANVAEMYAQRCKKKSADLLALMKVGGWLTAEEALAWGFVDELTDFEDESAPVLTDALAAEFTAHGIPPRSSTPSRLTSPPRSSPSKTSPPKSHSSPKPTRTWRQRSRLFLPLPLRTWLTTRRTAAHPPRSPTSKSSTTPPTPHKPFSTLSHSKVYQKANSKFTNSQSALPTNS